VEALNLVDSKVLVPDPLLRIKVADLIRRELVVSQERGREDRRSGAMLLYRRLSCAKVLK
jgi:hypothetical protein